MLRLPVPLPAAAKDEVAVSPRVTMPGATAISRGALLPPDEGEDDAEAAAEKEAAHVPVIIGERLGLLLNAGPDPEVPLPVCAPTRAPTGRGGLGERTEDEPTRPLWAST